MLARSSVLAVLAVLAAAPAAQAKNCNVQSDAEKLGASYVTSLTVKRISCATGKKLVRSYHSCRKARGGIKGRCPSFQGWSCREQRESIKTQFSAKATCTKGSRRFVQTYSQFT
jgi:hypothetical protein